MKAVAKFISMALIAGSLTLDAVASPEGPRVSESEHRISQIVTGISKEQYTQDLRILTGEDPVPARVQEGDARIVDRYRPPYIDLARSYIIDRLQRSGITHVYREDLSKMAFQTPRIGRALNLIGEVPGRLNLAQKSNEIIILSAHYDSRSIGVPGANDNGSGVAALLNIATELKRSGFQPDYTIRFVFFDAEELGGFTGSRTHRDSMSARGEKLRFMVNLDMIGDNPAGTRNLLYDDSGIFQNEIRDLFRDVNERYRLGFDFATWGPYNSDQRPFVQHSLPAISLFEHPFKAPGVETEGYHPYNHTIHDRIGTINVDYAVEMTRFIAALTLETSRDESVWNTPSAAQKKVSRFRRFGNRLLNLVFGSNEASLWKKLEPRTSLKCQDLFLK